MVRLCDVASDSRVEKYRPVNLDDVVSHQDITATLEKFIDAGRLPHLLLYGPPGKFLVGLTDEEERARRRLYWHSLGGFMGLGLGSIFWSLMLLMIVVLMWLGIRSSHLLRPRSCSRMYCGGVR